MVKITRQQYEHAFDAGKRVAKGLPKIRAISALAANTGMNERSAADYISFVEALIVGGLSERSVQYQAADYFMERIFSDFDKPARRKACQALGRYVEYYINANKVTEPAIAGILGKWCRQIEVE